MSPPVVPGSDVLEAVREDPDLVPMEKETTFRFAKDQDRADVFTSERGLTRRLLTFPPFDLQTVTLADGSRVDCIQSIDASEDTIVGVRGWVPIGCLKLRTSTRSRGSHAQLVTHASQRDPVVAPGGDAE